MPIQSDDYVRIIYCLSERAPSGFQLPEEITSDVNGLTCTLDLLSKVSSRSKFAYTTKKIGRILDKITNDYLRNRFIKASSDNDQVSSRACFNILMATSYQPSQISDCSSSESGLRNVDQSNRQVETLKSNAQTPPDESSVIREVESDVSEPQSDSAIASSSKFLTRLMHLESTLLKGAPDPVVTDMNLKSIEESLRDESIRNAVARKSVSSKDGNSKTLNSSRKSKKAKRLSGKVRKVQSHTSKIKSSPVPRPIRNKNSRKRKEINLKSPVIKEGSKKPVTDKSTKANGINEERKIGTINTKTDNSSKALNVTSESVNNSKKSKVKKVPDVNNQKSNKSEVKPNVNSKNKSEVKPNVNSKNKSEVKPDVNRKKASTSKVIPINTNKDNNSEVKSRNGKKNIMPEVKPNSSKKTKKADIKPDNKKKTSKADKPKSKKCSKTDVSNSKVNNEENITKEENRIADPNSFFSSEEDSDTGSEPEVGTMDACMNSIKRRVPRQVGTATPPLRMFLSANSKVHSDVSESDSDSFAGVPMKLNDKNVVKRMAKANKPKEGVENTAAVLNKVTKTPEALRQIMKMKKTNDSDSDSDINCSSFSED